MYSCNVCGSKNVSTNTQTEVYKYSGSAIKVPNYTKIHCHDCDSTTDDESSSDKELKLQAKMDSKNNK